MTYYRRPGSRRASPNRYDTSLSLPEYKPNDSRNPRSSTPSAAVRRALEVLDDSYKYQQDSARSRTRSRFNSVPRNRSKSPYRSRSPSPYRRNRSPIDFTPPTIAAIERDNYENALGESETRRNVLLKKLSEAQRTMEIQNKRLHDEQTDLGNTKATIKLLEQVQQELETKVVYLEKERSSNMIRQRDDAEVKEQCRRKIDELTHELKRLECEFDLISADKEDLQRSSSQLHENLRQLQDDNRKLLEAKNAGGEENSALRENLELTKERLKLMQREKEHAFTELNKNQESQQALINRNTDLSRSLTRNEDELTLMDDNIRRTEVSLASCQKELNNMTEKCTRQTYKLAELQTNQKELQSDLERSNAYNIEMEKTLKSLTCVNDQLKQAKAALGDNATSLHADLAKARLEISRISETKNHIKEELEAVKKLRKEISDELSEVKFKLTKKEDDLEKEEDARKKEVFRCNLLEAEIKEFKRDREDNNTRFVALQDNYHDLQGKYEDESRLNSQREIEMKTKIQQLEAKLKSTVDQLNRTTEELKATVEHDSKQIDHWRQTCSKLTGLMEEKDRDLREANALRREAEHATEHAQENFREIQLELSDYNTVKLDCDELKAENKRLQQECLENRQMISVLELQRDVLVKQPPAGKTTEFADSEIPEQINQLKNELKNVAEKINGKVHFSDEKDDKLKILESKYEDSVNLTNEISEELDRYRQEVATMKGLLEAKEDAHKREMQKVERDNFLNQERIVSLEDEAKVLRSSLTQSAMSTSDIVSKKSNQADIQSLNEEISRLKKETSERSQDLLVAQGQVLVMENGKARSEETIKGLRKQIREINEMHQKSRNRSEEVDDAVAKLKVKTAQLDAAKEEIVILRTRIKDIEELHGQQENLIRNLRKQLIEARSAQEQKRMRRDTTESDGSEKSVVVELNTVRRDLQRAFEDIAARDQQMAELRRKLIMAQKFEQKARQERDELKGKTIIMETITDSNQDLHSEVENLRKDKLELERQLTVFCTSKTSQTPPDSLTLVEDMDKELHNQYKTICARNKWLENRISSLLREIELLRDQNSLLIEEKNSADHETELAKGELKKTTISAKSARQQKALEEIHLKNVNAEKTQEVLNLKQELREKNMLLQMLSSDLDSSKRKSDKKKISAFMKKLRRSSSSGNTAEPGKDTMAMSASFGGLSTQTTDRGYSSLPLPKTKEEKFRSRSLTTSPMTSLDDTLFDADRIPRKSSHQHPQKPTVMKGLSPSPTTTMGKMSSRRAQSDDGYLDDKSYDHSVGEYISDTGEILASPQGKQSPRYGLYRPQPSKRTPKSSSKGADEVLVSFDDNTEHFQESSASLSGHEPSPEVFIPHPSDVPRQPSPTSSPSTASPRSARRPPMIVTHSADELSFYSRDDEMM